MNDALNDRISARVRQSAGEQCTVYEKRQDGGKATYLLRTACQVGDQCTVLERRQEGGIATVRTSCYVGESRTMARASLQVGETGFWYELDIAIDPPADDVTRPQSVMQGRYTGPCRDGLVPGDVLLPYGIKKNIQAPVAVGAPSSGESASAPK